jgi:hypothetical protein
MLLLTAGDAADTVATATAAAATDADSLGTTTAAVVTATADPAAAVTADAAACFLTLQAVVRSYSREVLLGYYDSYHCDCVF